MTHERKILIGTVELNLLSLEGEWNSIGDFIAHVTKEIGDELDAILTKSSFKPMRTLFVVKDGYDGPALRIYGYRPETDKEAAARKRRQRAKQEHAAAQQTKKEKRERKRLAELLRLYPDAKTDLE